MRATDFVVAAWLLYRAYDAFHDLSRETAHWAIPQACSEVLVGVLVLFRTPPEAVRVTVFSVAAVAVSNWHYLAYDLGAEGPPALAALGTVLLVAAVYVGVLARVTLGRSFAVLPAVRGLRTKGPYRVVRHPIYLALVTTDAGLVLAHPSPRNAALAAVAIAAHVARVFEEEAVWRRRAEYRAYARSTRYRLVPGVF